MARDQGFLYFVAMTKNGSLFLGILWFLIINVLFFLPGSALPKNDWLGDIYFDKWVHVGFFALLAWLWCMALALRKFSQLALALVVAGLYGFIVEVIQDQWVLNRSFDAGDLAADLAGACLGIAYHYYRTYIKK